MLLREMVENKHCNFIDGAASWEEAVRLACGPLEADGTVDPTYASQIVECVKKYGPYIVLLPGIAMPHAGQGEGVNGTAVSFMKSARPIPFAPGDSEKDAMLFFTLASTDAEVHLRNMQKLSALLMNEEFRAELFDATCPEDLLRLDEKYSTEA